ncbi:ATP-binding protein [Frankia sp. Cppng1_Ct_nod]|uniref:ATP-binding protein n=1 Tax=Frankia sp. Cppng1_Ct_nod TaxID=2897162 RepID=UPI001A9499D2|nr:ATP-binding protein [Frankia sp. Cppng1_Ct_nod]
MRRSLQSLVSEALADTRVVGVVGPRQAGKSTLVRRIVGESPDGVYISLDDRDARVAAEVDPRGFLAGRSGLLAIDEVQRVPELLLALKAAVDADERPGRFLVTGSSQLSANRGVSETLAGRIERFELWPLSQSELAATAGTLRTAETFLDRLLAGVLPLEHAGDLTKTDYLDRAVAGGYPEALRRSGARRAAWFDAYVETVVEREAPGVSASPRTAELPRLLRLVAARHASLLNVADLARDAGLPERTVHRYLDVLEAVFLVRRCPAWAVNLTQREIRAPKVFVTDPGLAAHLRGADIASLGRPEIARGADGPILEGMVYSELLRQSGWSAVRPSLFHYRDRAGAEIDLVIEDRSLRVVGIEVKAAADVSRRDIRHLVAVRDRLGERFVAGVVLHTGARAFPLGDRLAAVPISALWAS